MNYKDIAYSTRKIFLFEDETTKAMKEAEKHSLDTLFVKAFDNTKGLHPLSSAQAYANIDKYNIYFKLDILSEFFSKHCEQFDIDKKYQNIYKIDPLKDYDTQYKQIVNQTNPRFDIIRFYTDYKEPNQIIENRLELSYQALLEAKKNPTKTNLKQHSKIKKDELISKFLDSKETYKTGDLFA
jgi:hypothetical protein